MKRERRDHTLQTCALINEAYLRLDRSAARQLEQPGPLLRGGVADHAADSRRLCTIARIREAGRRRPEGPPGRGCRYRAAPGLPPDLVALDEALSCRRVKTLERRGLVQLRYFAGLTVEEIADVRKISTVTVMRGLELRARPAVDMLIVCRIAERLFHRGDCPVRRRNQRPTARPATNADWRRGQGTPAGARQRIPQRATGEPAGCMACGIFPAEHARRRRRDPGALGFRRDGAGLPCDEHPARQRCRHQGCRKGAARRGTAGGPAVASEYLRSLRSRRARTTRVSDHGLYVSHARGAPEGRPAPVCGDAALRGPHRGRARARS